ncbi:hypothetical protein AVEN_43932-1 [Araneus ventricosus]|uniref:Uncharacterized protein n=1 Tax=Araneus ventricosus TaxID=182803 RepID=A0A4Y2U1A7_ARAVE|nr:hypothetical protein AVEN_43932-1 [Araneus ventricosus]
MENKLCDLESVPDLFSDTGSVIDFVHSTPSVNNDDSFISSLRTQERDQTLKKAREMVANRKKWKYNFPNKRQAFMDHTKDPTSTSNTRATLDGTRNFEPGSDDEDRTTPELSLPSPNFHATPTGGCLATTYDLAWSMPHTRRIFSGIGFRTWNPPAPKLRPYH